MTDAITDDVREYVEKMRNTDFSDEQIRETLHEAGWTDGQIDTLLEAEDLIHCTYCGKPIEGTDTWWRRRLTVKRCSHCAQDRPLHPVVKALGAVTACIGGLAGAVLGTFIVPILFTVAIGIVGLVVGSPFGMLLGTIIMRTGYADCHCTSREKAAEFAQAQGRIIMTPKEIRLAEAG